MKVDIFKTTNKYKVIYADPPWRQSKGTHRNLNYMQGIKDKVGTVGAMRFKTGKIELMLLLTRP